LDVVPSVHISLNGKISLKDHQSRIKPVFLFLPKPVFYQINIEKIKLREYIKWQAKWEGYESCTEVVDSVYMKIEYLKKLISLYNTLKKENPYERSIDHLILLSKEELKHWKKTLKSIKSQIDH
jgi:hypothetical protein